MKNEEEKQCYSYSSYSIIIYAVCSTGYDTRMAVNVKNMYMNNEY